MNRRGRARLALVSVACVCCGCGGPASPASGPPVALRVENLTVTPATGPVACVLVQNRGTITYRGTVIARFPDGWKINRTEQPVTIPRGQTARVAFAIEAATNAESNSYPVEVKAVGAGTEVKRAQQIVCASAPYYRPRIDGQFDDWKDAIPVTFAAGGRKTILRTYWSRQAFCLLVAVEEAALVPYRTDEGAGACDAVQIALSPRDAATPASAEGKAQRHEFLLAAGAQPGPARANGTYDGNLGGKCFALMQPGQALAAALQPRTLKGLELSGAQLAVVRRNGVTYYECSIPFTAIGTIRPEPGRELCFSILVHDPDGTGLRDWGASAGLWPWQRSRLAWCNWQGAAWPKDPPFDNKIEWGFCSSRQ